MPTKAIEMKLLEAARTVAVAAEQLHKCDKSLSKVSPDAARNARKDVREAIECLHKFEDLLSRRVMSER
jgi:hypothetical protein